MDDREKHTQTKTNGLDQLPIFEVWKEYERIAMHFNDLLIRLRVQALGGVAVITALVGFLSEGETPEEFRWGLLAGVFLILVLFWLAIWFLDFRYYNKLLLGAVAEIIELEKLSSKTRYITELNISRTIEDSVHGKTFDLKGPGFWSGRHWFYILVLLALLTGLYFSTGQHCLVSSDNSLAQQHGVCALITHWNK